MKYILSIFIICLSLNTYSSTLPINTTPEGRNDYPTSDELIALAVEKGLLPDNPKDLNIEKHTKEKNTLILWLTSRRNKKIDTVDTLKNLFSERENVTIRNPSAYYVDQINGVIYNALKNGDIEGYNKKGVGTIFKTIAIQEGDFDTNDGRNAMEIMRDYWGEKEFGWYKNTYPEKFKALIEIDKK